MNDPREDTALRNQPIDLVVNGAAISSHAATLADLIEAEGLAGQRVATAVNGAFVPQARRAETSLTNGDRIEILTARQGG